MNLGLTQGPCSVTSDWFSPQVSKSWSFSLGFLFLKRNMSWDKMYAWSFLSSLRCYVNMSLSGAARVALGSPREHLH